MTALPRSKAESLLRCTCGNVFDLERCAPGEPFACPVCNCAHVAPARTSGGTGGLHPFSHSTQTADWSSSYDSRSNVNRISLPPETRLGRYLIDRELGRGGMGVVYLARDMDLDRLVALKLLPYEIAGPDVRDSFRREAQAAARVQHPNVAVIYSIESVGDALFFTMEYVIGETLAQAIARQRRLDAVRALEIIAAVADGLRAAMQHGIIHRDIKPSNIMIDAEGRPKITDFGLAKVGGVGMEVTRRGAVLGTPYYMSPEQGTGGHVDHRSDMYSLGITLYEMLAGAPPFGGANPIEIILAHTNQELPPLDRVPYPAEAIIRRLTKKQPSGRPAEYGDLAADLSRALAALRGGGAYAVLDVGDPSSKRLGDTLLRSQMALARTNVEMGRYEKAEKIYKKLLKEEDHLRIDGALLLGELYEKRGDLLAAAEHWRIVVNESKDPTEVAFARWKIGNTFEQRAATVNEQAVKVYRDILADEHSPFPRGLLEARIKHLEEGIAALHREISSSSVRLDRRESAT